MIKRIRSGTSVVAHEQWRSLDESVEVELTSEDPEWPIEHALLDQRTSGWRAAAAGSQTISLLWRSPHPSGESGWSAKSTRGLYAGVHAPRVHD